MTAMADNSALRTIYTFTKIAEGVAPSELFFTQAIDDEGTVLFRFIQDDPEPEVRLQAISTGFGEDITTIVDTTDPRFTTFDGADINDIGTVAFQGGRIDASGAVTGIFTSEAGVITPIVVDQDFDSSSPFELIRNSPEINNSGTVAFQAFGEGAGIFTIIDDEITTIADPSGPFQGFGGIIDINDSGEVAFDASLDSGGQGVFTGSGGDTTTIALDIGMRFDGIDINNSGTVAFAATDEGVFTGSGGPITTIADSSGPFRFFEGVAINDQGAIAFEGVLDNGNTGIFTGPDPVTDKVIASGDTLFGKTVSSAFLPGNNTLNNSGQIAFTANFEDGTSGVFRANPTFDTLTVDTLMDEDDGDLSSSDVSLREAIGFISPGGTIDFDPSLASADVGFGQGTIGLTLGELVIDKSLTINGLGADELTVSGNDESSIFEVNDGDSNNNINVAINGLTIANGVAFDGAAFENSEDLTINNSTISDNSASEGSGIKNNETGNLTINNSTISGNSADGRGGGVFNDRGTVKISNSTLSGNTASSGAAIVNDGGVLEISSSTITGNSSDDEGGGIANAVGYIDSTLKVIDSTISDNSAGGDGGGITNRGTLIVKNSTISGNTSNDQGGGIYSQSTVEVKNSTISGNTASESGGGIHNSGDGTVEVIDSTILDNTAQIDGGGIYNTDDGIIGLTGTIVQGNIAGDDGGGIANFDNGFITVDSSTIEGNEAIGDDGGGIYNIGNGTVEVIRSLIIDNIANTTSGTGGGILNRGTARVIDNSLISGNSASEGGGIFNENFLELSDSFTIGNIPNDVVSV